jgi:hypothetical protein
VIGFGHCKSIGEVVKIGSQELKRARQNPKIQYQNQLACLISKVGKSDIRIAQVGLSDIKDGFKVDPI